MKFNIMRKNGWLFLALILALTWSGCAKLPLDNGVPAAPELSSDGLITNWGVEFVVSVDDPDGDMVTLLFEVQAGTGPVQEILPTSFIASGQQESFYLNLAVGQWTVSVRAKDEWEEISSATVLDLTVSTP